MGPEQFAHSIDRGRKTLTPPLENIEHPPHYLNHPSGVECITVTEHFNFNRGNAIKYIWRAGLKGDSSDKEIEDLEKARWYLTRELERLKRKNETK